MSMSPVVAGMEPFESLRTSFGGLAGAPGRRRGEPSVGGPLRVVPGGANCAAAVTAFETETTVRALGDSEAERERAEEEREELASIPFYGKAAAIVPVKEEWVKRRQSEQMIPPGATLERVMRYEAHPSTRLRAGPST
jgi:hypothetical protein